MILQQKIAEFSEPGFQQQSLSIGYFAALVW
jgi:hypothetical protein